MAFRIETLLLGYAVQVTSHAEQPINDEERKWTWRQMRELGGVITKDLWRYLPALCGRHKGVDGSSPWVWLSNRHERLTGNPVGLGVQCEWQWGSELHACKVLPVLGKLLLRVALADWPIRFCDVPESNVGPIVSFLFAHRGRERLPQLQQVLRSVFAQRDIRVECIVADFSPETLASELPSAVRCLPVRTEHLPPGWYKAWGYNLASRQASGEILVFQDGDVCVPESYGRELVRTILQQGHAVASLQRYLFYLDVAATRQVYRRSGIFRGTTPVRVWQNWKGGTIAVARDAFFSLGGFDEGFVDWGGEDDEFYQRCGHLRHCRFGYLPFVHLHHESQPDRHGADNLNITQVLPWRLDMPAVDRVEELIRRGFGDPTRPHPSESYKSHWATKCGAQQKTIEQRKGND